MIKTAQVRNCEFSGDWKAPNGDIINYHTLTLSNGDTGSVGTAEKYAQKISVGATINYTLNGNKIKLVQEDNSAAQSGGSSQPRKKSSGGSRKPKQSDFLGYACRYAADMVIAGKAKAADIKAFKKAAEEIYSHIGELLENDHPKEE